MIRNATLAMNEFQALIGSGPTDLRMTVTKVSDTNTSRKVQQPPTILEFSPRSLGPNHDRVTGDPAEPLCNMFGADVL